MTSVPRRSGGHFLVVRRRSCWVQVRMTKQTHPTNLASYNHKNFQPKALNRCIIECLRDPKPLGLYFTGLFASIERVFAI